MCVFCNCIDDGLDGSRVDLLYVGLLVGAMAFKEVNSMSARLHVCSVIFYELPVCTSGASPVRCTGLDQCTLNVAYCSPSLRSVTRCYRVMQP